MSDSQSDALVFFGATGDLAYKKIFPALQAMIKRGHLDVPVIGVAKAGWDLQQLRTRAHDSLAKHGGVDAAAFDKLNRLLRYVDGDYTDPATFQAIRKELAGAQHPAHYLAIPPLLFGTPRASVQLQDTQPEARHAGTRAGTRRLGRQADAHARRQPGLSRAIGLARRLRPRRRAHARRYRHGPHRP